jgi:hypothetical protein
MATITSQNTSLRLFTSLKIRISDILGETITYLQETFKQSRAIFTAASPFGQLLIVFENLSQLIFYYIEDSITELNIYEASRPSSIYSLASLAGHNPSRAIGATAQVRLLRKPGIIPTSNKAILNNLFRLTCSNNGLTYVMELPQDEVRLNLTGAETMAVFSLRQGQIESQTVTAKGKPLDSFSIGYPNNYYIDQFMVNVYVNGEQWTKYDSLLDIPRNAKGFFTKTGITNGLDVYFGNGSFGKIPDVGSEIVIEYLVSEGSNGNIRVDDARQVQFTFSENAFSPVGEELNLNEYFDIATISPPSFGVDPEDIELTRLIAPKQSKNFALVNQDNYEVLLHKMQMFSTVRVFLNEANSRVINLFLIPDVTQLFKTSADYFKLSLDRFILTPFQKNELVKYIEKSGTKLVSTDIALLDPILTKYVLNISVIGFDDVENDVIKTDITDAIGNYFIKLSRNDRVPKSDLITVVESVNGVDSVSISIVSELNELAFISDPNRDPANLVGLDEFNDIVMKIDEFPVIRGGWTDRYGNNYAEGISDTTLGAVNIEIKAQKATRKKLTLL